MVEGLLKRINATFLLRIFARKFNIIYQLNNNSIPGKLQDAMGRIPLLPKWVLTRRIRIMYYNNCNA